MDFKSFWRSLELLQLLISGVIRKCRVGPAIAKAIKKNQVGFSLCSFFSYRAERVMSFFSLRVRDESVVFAKLGVVVIRVRDLGIAFT